MQTVMLYVSETWYSREGEILRRTEVGMCGVQLFYRRTEDLMELLGLGKLVEWLARANAVRWYGCMLRGGWGVCSEESIKEEDVEGTGGGGEWVGLYKSCCCGIEVDLDSPTPLTGTKPGFQIMEMDGWNGYTKTQ